MKNIIFIIFISTLTLNYFPVKADANKTYEVYSWQDENQKQFFYLTETISSYPTLDKIIEDGRMVICGMSDLKLALSKYPPNTTVVLESIAKESKLPLAFKAGDSSLIVNKLILFCKQHQLRFIYYMGGKGHDTSLP